MRTELKAFADANPESLNILNASAELIKLREYAEKNGKNVEAMNAYMKKKKEEADAAGSGDSGFESMYGDSQCNSDSDEEMQQTP